jgi:acylglycerol lipase
MRLALVVVAACAHTPNLELRPEAPAPAGQEVGTFEAADGTKLWHRKWLPTAPQKGVLIIQHGLRDHGGNYDHLARRAAAAGFAVWAADLRGHARSAGPRVAPKPWRVYIDDFERFIALVARAEPNQPIFLYGHSMGGAIAALTVADKQPAPVKGLILSAPVLNLGVPPMVLAAIRLMGTIAPNLGVLKLDPKAFSTNPAIAEAIVKDPLVEQGAGPASTAAGLAAGAAEIWARVDRLTLPILALHGTADRLTAPSGSRALIEVAPSTDKTLKIYDGFSHDLVHEPKGEQVEDDVLAWLAAHTGGPAMPPTPVYTGKLHGDPKGSVLSIQLGGGVVGLGETDMTGVFELVTHFARKRPIGFGGALLVRASGDGFEGALMPVGISTRVGSGALGVASGIATLPEWELAIPVRAFVEAPLGPLHATVHAQLDYLLSDSDVTGSLAGSDLFETGIALRVPGDRAYWPRAFAGVGPYVRGTLVHTGGLEIYVLTAGLALYGAD